VEERKRIIAQHNGRELLLAAGSFRKYLHLDYGNPYMGKGSKLTYGKVQYALLHYCGCAEVKASKHGSHFVDINLGFFLNMFIEFALFVTQYSRIICEHVHDLARYVLHLALGSGFGLRICIGVLYCNGGPSMYQKVQYYGTGSRTLNTAKVLTSEAQTEQGGCMRKHVGNLR